LVVDLSSDSSTGTSEERFNSGDISAKVRTGSSTATTKISSVPDRRRPPATSAGPLTSKQTLQRRQLRQGPTSRPHQLQDRSPTVQRLQHCRMNDHLGMRASQDNTRATTVSSKSFYDALMPNPQDQVALTDACAQRRRPGRAQSVNDQEAGGLAGQGRGRQAACTAPAVWGLNGIAKLSYIGWSAQTSPRQPVLQHQLRPRFVSPLLVKPHR